MYRAAGLPTRSVPTSMASTPTKLQRWLDVIAYLASRRFPVPTEELWSAVPAYQAGLEGSEKDKQTVRRMFERDKDELRAFGVPIETVHYSMSYRNEAQVGYRLRRSDFHLPYLKLLGAVDAEAPDTSTARRSAGAVFELTEEEAGAALDGLLELASVPAFPLARAARSAFRKLAFDLDPALAGDAPVVYAHDPEAEASTELVKRLSDAARRRKRVTFRYRAMTSDSEAGRSVHPWGLLFQHGRWYLIGHDNDREAARLYRVGRIHALKVNTRKAGTPDYEVPEDFTLRSWAGRKAWELGADEAEPTEVTVHFRFPRSLWAERNGHGTLVEEEADGSQRRRFAVHRSDPFLRWVLSLAGDAVVVDPQEAAEAFRSLAASVAAVHGAAPADPGGPGAPRSEPA